MPLQNRNKALNPEMVPASKSKVTAADPQVVESENRPSIILAMFRSAHINVEPSLRTPGAWLAMPVHDAPDFRGVLQKPALASRSRPSQWCMILHYAQDAGANIISRAIGSCTFFCLCISHQV